MITLVALILMALSDSDCVESDYAVKHDDKVGFVSRNGFIIWQCMLKLH